MSYLQYNSSPLTRKSYLFGVRVIKTVKGIKCSPKEYGMINQLFRSGTAIGALVSEAIYAQSPADFINKLSIALKEYNSLLAQHPQGYRIFERTRIRMHEQGLPRIACTFNFIN